MSFGATNAVITDGTTGGININVVKVITQTTRNNELAINAEANKGYILTNASLQTITLPSSLVGDVCRKTS